MPYEIARVRYELEKLRHAADHERYECSQRLASIKAARTQPHSPVAVNEDVVRHYTRFRDQLANDVEVYDFLLKLLEENAL